MTSRDNAREYTTDAIAVHWQPARCIHSGICFSRLPEVFRPAERPWVQVEAAPAEAIAEVVHACPSGALHYERLDGGPQEQPDSPSVLSVPNGPLYVRGEHEVFDPEGRLIRKDVRMALCRCGHSENKPFCDVSHRRVGFRG